MRTLRPAPTREGAVTRELRDLLLTHAAFAVVATVALLLPGPLGWRILGALVAYDVMTVVVARTRGHTAWLRRWWFGAVLSVLMVAPDMVLAEGLGTLLFPNDGLTHIVGVSPVMALMWTVPFVVLLTMGEEVERRASRGAAVGAVVGVGAVLFGVAEATLPLLPVWVPAGVATVGTVALYILPAEVLLCVAVYDAFQSARNRGWAALAASTPAVMLLYVGAAATSWLAFERVLA